jgi:hypothetical protein
MTTVGSRNCRGRLRGRARTSPSAPARAWEAVGVSCTGRVACPFR